MDRLGFTSSRPGFRGGSEYSFACRHTHTHTANEENVVSGVEKKNKYVFSHSARLRHDLVSISCELTLGARVRAGIPVQKRTHKICVKETPGGSEEALCDPFLLNISCEHHQTPAHTPPPLSSASPTRPVPAPHALPRPMMYACIRACLRRRQKGREG